MSAIWSERAALHDPSKCTRNMILASSGAFPLGINLHRRPTHSRMHNTDRVVAGVLMALRIRSEIIFDVSAFSGCCDGWWKPKFHRRFYNNL